jgi:hypothetical protein
VRFQKILSAACFSSVFASFFLPWLYFRSVDISYNGPQVIALAVEYAIPLARWFYLFPVLSLAGVALNLLSQKISPLTDPMLVIILGALAGYYKLKLSALNASFDSDVGFGYGLVITAVCLATVFLSRISSLFGRIRLR